MPIATIFLIAALILFILGALPIASPVNLTAAGLACFTVAALAGTRVL